MGVIRFRGHPKRGYVREATRALVLSQHVAERRALMLGLVRRDRVALMPDGIVRLQSFDLEIERQLIHLKANQLSQRVDRLGGREDTDGFFAALQAHGPQEAEGPQVMVGVEVGEVDISHREADAKAKHLPLRPLAAIEQMQVTLTVHREGARITRYRWSCRRRSQKDDSKHGPHYRRGAVGRQCAAELRSGVKQLRSACRKSLRDLPCRPRGCLY